MNEGLLAAKGDFVCFVSADDKLSSGAVVGHEIFLITPGLTVYLE
jgi:hypothetical protein